MSTRIIPAVLLATTALFLLAFAACGGGGDGDDPTAPHTPPSGQIIGAAGGTLTAADGQVSLDFPADAVTTEISVTVQACGAAPADAGMVASRRYEFGPDGTHFRWPVAVTIRYDPSALPAGVAQEDLRLCHVVEDTWASVTWSSVDTAAHTVSGAVWSFSSYGVGHPVGASGSYTCTLTPDAILIIPEATTGFEADIDPEPDPQYPLVYHWHNTGIFGHFPLGDDDVEGSSPVASYEATEVADGDDVITCAVYQDRGHDRILLARGEALVNVRTFRRDATRRTWYRSESMGNGRYQIVAGVLFIWDPIAEIDLHYDEWYLTIHTNGNEHPYQSGEGGDGDFYWAGHTEGDTYPTAALTGPGLIAREGSLLWTGAIGEDELGAGYRTFNYGNWTDLEGAQEYFAALDAWTVGWWCEVRPKAPRP